MIAEEAIRLLEKLVAAPSLSHQEDLTAEILVDWLSSRGVEAYRVFNNVWAVSDGYDPSRPTLLLNSHHDTVKPSPEYSFDPFTPQRRDGRIYGLGTNDAGASVVSMASAFCALRGERLPFNLVLGLTAEEEVSGDSGIRALLPYLAALGVVIKMAIVGEPTGMRPAVAERGLVVLDCVSHGVAGHAARDEGVNAIYRAMEDISRLRDFKFDRVSDVLGDIKVSVTQIRGGRQHNVVPDSCSFVVDVRTTDAYSNEETVKILRRVIEADAVPRSTCLRASVLPADHPLAVAAVAIGGEPFVSSTMSDMALMCGIPSLKMGPGESARSHTADEYVCEREISEAIPAYISLLRSIDLAGKV